MTKNLTSSGFKWTWLVALVVLLTTGWILFPMAYRTCLWASDARGLTVIALMEENQVPLDPFHRESMFVTPAMATWALKTFDWPYQRCAGIMRRMDSCDQPLVNMVGASLGMHSDTLRARGYELIRHFISRGEAVNKRFRGLAPVHEAILFQDAGYLQLLLEVGADPYAEIRSSEKPFDGLDAFGFLDFLDARDDRDFTPVREVLEGWQQTPG